jgi:hypothetical protein
VREATGFGFDAGSPGATPVPTAEELMLLRGPVGAQIAADYPEFAKRLMP